MTSNTRGLRSDIPVEFSQSMCCLQPAQSSPSITKDHPYTYNESPPEAFLDIPAPKLVTEHYVQPLFAVLVVGMVLAQIKP